VLYAIVKGDLPLCYYNSIITERHSQSYLCYKKISVLEVAYYRFRSRTSSSGDGGEKFKIKAVLVFKGISFIQNFLVISELRYKSIIWLGTA